MHLTGFEPVMFTPTSLRPQRSAFVQARHTNAKTPGKVWNGECDQLAVDEIRSVVRACTIIVPTGT